MYHEFCAAIVPHGGLAETLSCWREISRGLAEPKRKRQRHQPH
jgi:hypothetical protein